MTVKALHRSSYLACEHNSVETAELAV